MKNIHLLPTTPNDEMAKGIWIKETRDWCNIYITADEEIKPNKYCLINGVLCKTELLDSRIVSRQLTGGATMDICKSKYSEIILTTDPELITDGVQAIPDDFLEWFVKNPSCEFVEVKANFNHPRGVFGYQTIIPKEEQKQNLIDMMQDDEKLGLYKQQTAVEWLEKQLDIVDAYKIKVKTIIEYAKEMEKQQIIEAFWSGDNTDCLSEQNAKEFAEKYYNETYGKQDV